MRRRFGRGRRSSGGDAAGTPIDASQWLPRILELGVVEAVRLDPVSEDDIAPGLAALGEGEREAGRPLWVGFAPEHGGDAALAVLALASRRRSESETEGDLVAIAPDWSPAARRRLGLLQSAALPIEALAATSLHSPSLRIEPASAASPYVSARQVGQRLPRSDDRDVFDRAYAALEGLAAKHGGALRGREDRVELVLLCRRVAQLLAIPGDVRLEVTHPERAVLSLGGETLATSMDRLEGLIRKQLNDRRIRGSEAGMRAALVPILDRAAGLTARAIWPLSSGDGEAVDVVGLTRDGVPVVAAARQRFGLEALGQVLDAAAECAPILSDLAGSQGRPVNAGPPRVVLAAGEFDRSVLDVAAAVSLDVVLFDAAPRRTGEWGLESRALGVFEAREAPAPRPRSRRRPPRRESAPSAEDVPAEERPSAEPVDVKPDRPAIERSEEAEGSRFEEVSLFDLDDDARGSEEPGGDGAARRRRGRGRRRGRRGRGAEGGGRGDRAGSEEPIPATPGGDVAPGESAKAAADSDDDAILASDDDETLAPLDADAPELDEPAAPAYDDEEERDEGDDDADRARLQRELRRRARAAKPEEPPRPPRRRAAFVAHADPVSVLTTIVLARDVRLVEGFWVYPQSDLMRFFRGVATDLRDETPIFLVGFAASPPARDTFQAAALYRDRLDWFDHHDWPPEDLVTLRETIGEDHVHVQPGAESSLASVIAERTRRSRFSDKLVELITGRFTQHDYERWGRLWWHRAQQIAGNPGERRSDIDALLSGRPSDLAKEAARATEPPLPPELSYVSERDFRLVHFGGFTMVVLEVPQELDLHLASRIARERYDAQLSLTTVPGRELVVLGGDESRARRGLDLDGMTAHLASKHEWIEALPDDDHVARVRVRSLHSVPGRFDELITEIAMGRSIVEG